MVDISDFSEIGKGHNESLQQSAMHALTWYLHHRFLPELISRIGTKNACNELFFMFTLDGCIVASKANLYSEFVELSFEWIDFMSEHSESAIGLRAGLHQGAFFASGLGEARGADEEAQIFGTGPNDCDRIARIGDAGNVFASEAFVAAWQGANPKARVFPSKGPIIAFPKRGRPQAVRLILRDAGVIEEPSYLRRKAIIDTRIRQDLLPTLYDYIIDDLQCGWRKMPEDIRRLGLRVSFFVLDPAAMLNGAKQLTCVARYAGEDYAGADLTKGSTRYEVGVGPVGMAFAQSKHVRNELVTKRKLPNPVSERRDWEEYMQNVFKLPGEKIADMVYRARAFIVVPVRFSSEQAEPSGVLCVDFKHPLASCPKGVFQELAEEAFDWASPNLAAHWELRTS